MDTNIKSLASGNREFCLIHKQDSDNILVLTGKPRRFSLIGEIPRQHGPTGSRCYDSISIGPYCQIKEKGYETRDNKEEIRTICVEEHYELPDEYLARSIEHIKPVMAEGVEYDTTETEYVDNINKIMKNEIGNGEGANFVIPRNAHATIQNFSLLLALSIFTIEM